MVNQPQGHNSMDSSAALLQQQQHNFDVQVSDSQLFYSFMHRKEDFGESLILWLLFNQSQPKL